MEEKEHILKILKGVKIALIEENSLEIRELSNRITHTASIHQEADILSLAVIIYALSKIVSRKDYQEEKNWGKFFEGFLKNIDDMIQALKKDDLKRFHNEVQANRQLIQKLSGNLRDYIKEVFRNAKINKASRLYEHGISREKTAKILGISLWELSEYSGRTGIHNVNLAVTMSIKQRIKLAEEIFR
jgi:hypothetical protein